MGASNTSAGPLWGLLCCSLAGFRLTLGAGPTPAVAVYTTHYHGIRLLRPLEAKATATPILWNPRTHSPEKREDPEPNRTERVLNCRGESKCTCVSDVEPQCQMMRTNERAMLMWRVKHRQHGRTFAMVVHQADGAWWGEPVSD